MASAHSPVWSTRGLIAFRDDDDDWISVIRPDGSGRRRLARADLDGSFDWSPGGRRLVYADPDSKLSIIDANGSHVRRLKRSGDNPAFAPSGRMIVYSEPGGKLFTTDLRGRRRHLVRTNLDVFGPSDWQPLPRRGHR